MEQPVTQPLGLCLGKLAIEGKGLGPDEQVVRERDDLQPDLVERKGLERGTPEDRVLIVADAVLDVLAVAALHDGDVWAGWSVRIDGLSVDAGAGP